MRAVPILESSSRNTERSFTAFRMTCVLCPFWSHQAETPTGASLRSGLHAWCAHSGVITPTDQRAPGCALKLGGDGPARALGSRVQTFSRAPLCLVERR